MDVMYCSLSGCIYGPYHNPILISPTVIAHRPLNTRAYFLEQVLGSISKTSTWKFFCRAGRAKIIDECTSQIFEP
ncbi:hypothetical protein M758_9G007700 [Ceratodon purpureus]|uniref:Uncharacterized protein n=1 Tax=Ceratodon purpureus TaxID=3225 RepID=A0A8T0GMF1_CERPU|nr:hypothetical protein KC19_9G008100 [Ceratodon purpureus]KAG0604788.1 hypothetical protein M758_9G007700 [Ceratodon purpureus]